MGGYAGSTDLCSGAGQTFDSSHNGAYDAFVAKLAQEYSAIVDEVLGNE